MSLLQVSFRSGLTTNLGSGESLIVNVMFAPTEARTYDDTLFVLSNAPDSAVAVRVTGEGVVNAADDGAYAVRHYELHPAYPNPFNATTTISYEVGRPGPVTLTVLNLLGQEVCMLVNGVQTAGRYDVDVNVAGWASGVYVYRLEAGGTVEARKMVLLK